MEKTGKLAIHVILDSNSIYSQAPDAFVGIEARTLLEELSAAAHIDVFWYVPHVVRGERQVQMNAKAEKLLSSIPKLESFMGCALNVTQADFLKKIEDKIAEQAGGLQISFIDLDTKRVDWSEIIRRSVYREPPFDPVGEKEKGFRDALVLETFCQFLDSVPEEPSKRLAYLVSKDGRLREAAEQRTQDRDNVRIVEAQDDLRNQLNALNFEVADVEKLLPLANEAFFTDGESLYPKYVYYQIFEVNASVITSKPRPDAVVRVIGTSIDSTTFIAKADAKLSFQTKVRVKVEASYRRPSSDYYYSGATVPGTYITSATTGTVPGTYVTSATTGTYLTSATNGTSGYIVAPSTGHYTISPVSGASLTDISPASAATSITTAASPVVGLLPHCKLASTPSLSIGKQPIPTTES